MSEVEATAIFPMQASMSVCLAHTAILIFFVFLLPDQS